jgi:DNA-binding MarR family transcriptional regulator
MATRQLQQRREASVQFERIPKAGEGKRGEDGHVGYLMRQASAAMKQSFERRLRPLGLTHPQFVILTMCKAYGARSGADLAHLAHLTPQTVTVITSNLVRARYLKRQPDPNHAKVVLFAITEKGAGLLAKARTMLEEVEASFTSGLTSIQLNLIQKWLVSVVKIVEEEA